MKRCLSLLLLFVLVSACAGAMSDATAYEAANQSYHVDSVRYSQARAVFVDTNGSRKPGVTDEQWSRFRVAEPEVITADQSVYDDLNAWHRSGAKPSTFDANVAALRAAQQKVITLSQEVR